MTPQLPPDLPPLREVIREHGLSAQKRLGQHFLLDMNITRKIAAAAGDLTGKTVLEVGPGPGGLTRALLETNVRRVIAVETDRRAVQALAGLQNVAGNRLQVVQADAMNFDATPDPGERITVVANLPYNISTALLGKWLEIPDRFAEFVLMFQREVADRLVAEPGNKNYGRLSVLAQAEWQVRKLFDLSPTAFTPPPKVHSSIVQIYRPVGHISPKLSPDARQHLRWIVKCAFGQRRKMLRQSLKPLGPMLESLLAETGIDPKCRAENVTVRDYIRLASLLLSSDHPPDCD